MHNLIIALLLLLFIGIIPISCCPGKSKPYYSITSWQSKAFSNYNYSTAIVDTITTDSLFIRLDYTKSYFAATNVNPFITTSYACKMPPNGYNGLKDKIKSIAITSTTNFNSYTSGQNLSSLFKCQQHYLLDTLITTDSLVTLLNKEAFSHFNTLGFVLINKPVVKYNHTFNFTITYISGAVQQVATPTLHWQ